MNAFLTSPATLQPTYIHLPEDTDVCKYILHQVSDTRAVESTCVFGNNKTFVIPYTSSLDAVQPGVTTGAMFKQLLGIVDPLADGMFVPSGMNRCPCCNAPLIKVTFHNTPCGIIHEHYCVNLACKSYLRGDAFNVINQLAWKDTYSITDQEIVISIAQIFMYTDLPKLAHHLKYSCKASTLASFFRVPAAFSGFYAEVDSLFGTGLLLRDAAISQIDTDQYDPAVTIGLNALRSSLMINQHWLTI